MSEVASASI